MEKKDLFFELYEKQLQRTLQLAELLGNAIAKLRFLEQEEKSVVKSREISEFIEFIERKFNNP
jgi:hypothetical protein